MRRRRDDRSRATEAMEDKLRALLHADAGQIDQGIAESFIDRANGVAKLACLEERKRALVVSAIDLFPGRSNKYLRIVKIKTGGLLTRWELETQECGIAKNVGYSAVE